MKSYGALYQVVLASTFFLTSVSYADLIISGNDSSPHQTSVDGNITVTTSGNLNTNNATAITVNSANVTVDNKGTIENSSTIASYPAILVNDVGLTLSNSGLIDGTNTNTNAGSGTIMINKNFNTITNMVGGKLHHQGGDDGVVVFNGASTGQLINQGTISGNVHANGAILHFVKPFNGEVENQGLIDNQSNTGAPAVYLLDTTHLFTNSGTIQAKMSGGYAIYISGGTKGTFINTNTGVVYTKAQDTFHIGANFTEINNAGTMENATGRLIATRGNNISIANGITNSGTIAALTAGQDAINLQSGNNITASLTNSGTITGNVKLASAGGNVLQMTGGTINGTVTAGNTASTLTLTAGRITGALTGGTGADTFNINGSSSSFLSLDGGGGADVLNINADYATPGPIAAIPTINVAANKTFTVNQNITNLDTSLLLNAGAKMIVNANVTGTSAMQNNGSVQINTGNTLQAASYQGGTLQNSGTLNLTANQIMDAGTVTNKGAINLVAGALLGNTLLTQNAGTITGNIGLANAGGTVLTMTGGTINGTVTAGPIANTLELQGGSITKTVTLGNAGDTVNLSGTTLQTLDGGAGADTFNVSGGSFTSLNGHSGTDVLNINDDFTAGPITAVPMINVATNKKFITSTITGLNMQLNIHAGAQMTTNGVITGTGAAQNDGTLITNKNMTIGPVTNNDTIQIKALFTASQLIQNTGTITGNVILGDAGGSVLQMNNGIVNGNMTAQGPNANTFTLTGGRINGTLTAGAHGDTIHLNGTTLQTLNGGVGADTFNVSGGSFTSLNGQGGADVLNINDDFTAGPITAVPMINVATNKKFITSTITSLDTQLNIRSGAQMTTNGVVTGTGAVQNDGTLITNKNMTIGPVTNRDMIQINALFTTPQLIQSLGRITGNVILGDAGGNVLQMSNGIINGNITAQGPNANTFTLTGGQINGTLTLGDHNDIVNLFNTQAKTIQGGAGDDTINIQATGGNFTLADGGAGNNILNVNADFIANGNINDFQTIHIAPAKIFTANQTITDLDTLLSLGNKAQMIANQDVSGKGQVQNAGLIQLNANRTLAMGALTNNGDIQIGTGLVKGTKLTHNAGTITGEVILTGIGGEVLALKGGVVNGTITAQGPAVNIFNLTGGALNGTLTLGDHGDTVNLDGVAVQTLQGGAGNDILNVNATVTNGLIQNIETIQVKNAGTVFTVNQPIQNVNTLLAVSPNTQLVMNASIRGAGNVQNQGRLQVNNAQVLALPAVINQDALTLQEAALIQANTFTQNGGASLSFGLLDGTTFGKIELAGAGVSHLAGDLSVYFPGTPPKVQTDYDVVVATAGGQIVDNTNFVTPALSGLQLRKWMPSPQILRITSTYNFYKGLTINATEAANALQSAQGSGDPDIRRVVNSISNMHDDETVTYALEGLIPAADHGAVTASRVSLQRLFDVVTHRQIELRNMQLGWQMPTGVNAGDGDRCYWGEWGEVYGALIKQKPTPDNIQGLFTTTGYHANVAGFAFGGDFGNRNTARIGLVGSYTRMNVKSQMEFKNTLGINSYQLTAYSWFQPFGQALFTQVRVGLATNQYYNTRHINVNNEIKTAAIANYHGLYYGGEGEIGYALVKSHYYFAPIVKIKATRLHLDQYVEEGAGGLNLSVSGQVLNQFALGSGIRIADKQKNVIPEANFIVLHDFTNAIQNVTSTFLGGGDPFITKGVKTPKTLYEIGLSLTTIHDERYKVTARYEFDFRPGFRAYSGYVQLYYLWD